MPEPRSRRFPSVVVLVAVLVLLGATPDAFADRVRNQDPGGGSGGGGENCWAMTCSKCDTETHDVFPDITWDTCPNVAENGGCNCTWVSGKCIGPYGTCVYTG
jgi:hypothetical protein